MAMLNRSAIILIPKQLYADWANSLDDDGRRFEISEADDDLTVFLGPGYDTIEQIGAFATEHFDFFSEHWLEGWSLDAAEWPQRRTERMLREWFSVRIHRMVEDVVESP